jgi:hypothetical protein
VVCDIVTDTASVSVFEAVLSASAELFVCLQIGDRLWIVACLSQGGTVKVKKNIYKYEHLCRHRVYKENLENCTRARYLGPLFCRRG